MMDGKGKIGGREKRVATGTGLRHGGTAMAGVEVLAGTRGSGAMGHGSTNRGHRGREEVQATSPRPRMQPEDTTKAVVAMAGGVKLVGAHELGPRGQELQS